MLISPNTDSNSNFVIEPSLSYVYWIDDTKSSNWNAYFSFSVDTFLSIIIAALMNSVKSILPDSFTSTSLNTSSTNTAALSSSPTIYSNPSNNSYLLSVPSPSLSNYLNVAIHLDYSSSSGN